LRPVIHFHILARNTPPVMRIPRQTSKKYERSYQPISGSFQ